MREKLVELLTERVGLQASWEARWESLQLMREVYQFAHDAAVAECWLTSQEPYLQNKEIGVCTLCPGVGFRYLVFILIPTNLSDLRRHLTKWKFNCEDTKLSKERHPLKKTVLLLCNVLPRSIQTMNFKKMMLN